MPEVNERYDYERAAELMSEAMKPKKPTHTFGAPEPSFTFGDHLVTQQGAYIDVLNPVPVYINLEDVCSTLSKICRYGGHLAPNLFYSVAEHCFHCSNIARDRGHSADIQKSCLLHDAHEYILGDMIRPLKRNIPFYKQLCGKWDRVIEQRFGVSLLVPEIKQIDNDILIHEKHFIYRDTPGVSVHWEGEETVTKLDLEIAFYSPYNAYQRFKKRCKELGIK